MERKLRVIKYTEECFLIEFNTPSNYVSGIPHGHYRKYRIGDVTKEISDSTYTIKVTKPEDLTKEELILVISCFWDEIEYNEKIKGNIMRLLR